MKDIAGISKKTKHLIAQNIRSATLEQRYNDDVQPVDWENMQRVTQDFVFLPKNPFKIIWSFIARSIAFAVAKPLCFFGLGSTKIYGKKNFKNLKGAVIICNHVHIFDSFFVRAATKGHKLYITVAEFNNMKGPLGILLRGAGCIPFSDSFSAMKNLSKTTEKLLQKKHFVLFYPEKALWHKYEKPRPYIDGAFHTAVLNKVPVVPTFIAFKNCGKKSKRKVGQLYVLKPIFPKPNLSKKENLEHLKTSAFNAVCQCYQEIFGNPPYENPPVTINL